MSVCLLTEERQRDIVKKLPSVDIWRQSNNILDLARLDTGSFPVSTRLKASLTTFSADSVILRTRAASSDMRMNANYEPIEDVPGADIETFDGDIFWIPFS